MVAYLVALLSARSSSRLDLRRVWNAQVVTPGLEAMLRSWAVPVRDALVAGASSRQRNPTEWFKREECWTEVCATDLPMPALLPGEFGDGGRAIDLMPDGTAGGLAGDLAGAVRVKGLDAARWTGIAEWGGRTGKLHWRQSGIATTLSGMAAQQWRKDPSAKQVEAALTLPMPPLFGLMGEADGRVLLRLNSEDPALTELSKVFEDAMRGGDHQLASLLGSGRRGPIADLDKLVLRAVGLGPVAPDVELLERLLEINSDYARPLAGFDLP